jgi:hypothetical protein
MVKQLYKGLFGMAGMVIVLSSTCEAIGDPLRDRWFLFVARLRGHGEPPELHL